MTDGEFDALKCDIEVNGQREPITLWRGQVIDGLHRAKACELLHREPVTREWVGDEGGLPGYVVSLNLHRRHLNESQRAMIAEKLVRTPSEGYERREAMKGGASVSIDKDGKMSRDEAAGLLNVGSASVSRARKVRNHGSPVLVEAVERGGVSLHRAAHLADLPYSDQREAVENPPVRAVPKPNLFKHPKRDATERIDRTIDTIVNAVEVLTESAGQLNGDNRRAEWAKRLRSIRTEITRFIGECET